MAYIPQAITCAVHVMRENKELGFCNSSSVERESFQPESEILGSIPGQLAVFLFLPHVSPVIQRLNSRV